MSSVLSLVQSPVRSVEREKWGKPRWIYKNGERLEGTPSVSTIFYSRCGKAEGGMRDE